MTSPVYNKEKRNRSTTANSNLIYGSAGQYIDIHKSNFDIKQSYMTGVLNQKGHKYKNRKK